MWRERGVRYYHMSTITQFISILSYLLKAYETAVEGKKSLMPWKSPRDGGPSSNTNSSWFASLYIKRHMAGWRPYRHAPMEGGGPGLLLSALWKDKVVYLHWFLRSSSTNVLGSIPNLYIETLWCVPRDSKEIRILRWGQVHCSQHMKQCQERKHHMIIVPDRVHWNQIFCKWLGVYSLVA